MFEAMATFTCPGTVSEAIAAQQEMAGKVCLDDNHGELRTVAGIDCSYDIRNNNTFAVVVIMRLDDLQPLQTVRATMPTHFPYVPGLLSFREMPVMLKALRQLPEMPDLLMVDGQGIAHPRRLGIASHLGVLLDWPAVGVAKSLLTGRYQEPGLAKGDSSPLLDKANNKIGTVLRSKDNVKPLFISPGHRLSHETALSLAMHCLKKHRLPEPTRIADKISKDKAWFSSDAA